MKRAFKLATAAALALALAPAGAMAQKVTLNVATAGDQNMVDYIKDYLGPMFEKANANVSVRAVGTGPGDAGSQKIAEKLDAQKAQAAWDVDVAVVHQKMAGDMVKAGLLAPYTKDIASGKLTTSESSKNALGAKVEGYVIPMFQSQTAIAYNPMLVKTPPKTYADIEAWSKANPKQFGYNGIKGGMSGVSFVVGWVYANAPNPEQLTSGPYAAGAKAQDAMVDRLFVGYFTEGADIGDTDTLAALAGDAGLEIDPARRFLISEQGREMVMEDLSFAYKMGITGVPCFILEGKYALPGAHEPEAFQPLFDLAKQEAAAPAS